MYSKIAFLFLVSFLVVQLSSASPRVVRDTEEKKPDVFEDMKNNFDKFVKDNLQPDKLIDQISTNLKELGDKMEAGAKELAKNFKKEGQ